MRKYYILIKATMLLFVLGSLCSCVDDDYLADRKKTNDNLFTLKLPEKNIVNIKTRSATDTYGIENILAAVIRGEDEKVVVFEYVDQLTPADDKSEFVRFNLNTLGVKDDEELFIFCNVGDQSEKKLREGETLLNLITCGSGKDVMYGVRAANSPSNQVALTHSLSNVEVSTTDNKFGVDSLIICDVPKTGLASGEQYMSEEIEDVKLDSGTAMFFVPRPDNNNHSVTSTFILAKLTDKGWYRLDFYEGGNNLDDPTKRAELMKIEKNTFYHFEISSVTSNGYNSKEEARRNTGSNIVYNLSVDKNVSVSNGQYTLLADVDEILLYPNKPSGSIKLSALIPTGSVNDITTYSVKVYSSKEQVKILKVDGVTMTEADSVSLIRNGEKLTTENSLRTIEFESVKAWYQGDYLEISLGNIKKQIPFKLLSANSYLFDCAGNQEIKIPFVQANLERIRIKPEDAIDCKVIWSDQPNVHLQLKSDAAGWIKVTSLNTSFSGNVVIGAEVNGEIKWSWHLWCMASDKNPITFSDETGLYTYKEDYQQSYCNNVWMDRNLGAYKNEHTIGNAATRGLGYQWGRKDPFNIGGDCGLFHVDTVYNSGYWAETTIYASQQPSIEYKMGEIYQVTSSAMGFRSLLFPGTTIPNQQYVSESASSDEEVYENSIKYPFSIFSSGPGWRPTFDEYAWVSKGGMKTVNDPCPIGWRVPVGEDPNGPWYGLTLNNRVIDPSDPNEESGVRWYDADNQIVFFPFVLWRNGDGLRSSPDNVHGPGGLTRMYNKELLMHWANGFNKMGACTNFVGAVEYGGYNRGDVLTQFRRNEPYKAVPVRCVKDKSVKQ